MNVGVGHFMQTSDVGAFRSDDAREAGAIRKRKESDVGRRLCFLDRFRYGVFGLVDARLVTSLEVPRRFALLRVSVIFDNLPIGLSDGIFGIMRPSSATRVPSHPHHSGRSRSGATRARHHHPAAGTGPAGYY